MLPEEFKPLSKPYIINVHNDNGAAILPVNLFGFNRNYKLANFGNVAGITVTSGNVGVTYSQLLAQSQNQPFEVGAWQVSSANASQVDRIPVVTWYDANGRQCVEPIDVNKDPYQFDPNQVDFWYPCKIDGNAMVTFTVLPATDVQIKIYPRKVVSLSRPMIGSSSRIKEFRIPKIAGNNTTVLISKSY